MTDKTPASVAIVMSAYARQNAWRVMVGRCLVFLVIFFWLLFNYGTEVARAEIWTLTIFTLNGVLSYLWYRWRPQDGAVPYLVIFADCLILSFTLFWPGRIYPDEWPWTMALRMPSDAYYLILLGLALLSFQARLIVWAGFCILINWVGIYTLIARQTGAYVSQTADNDQLRLSTSLDPLFVDIEPLLVRGFVLVMLTALMAVAATRLRQLLLQLAKTARERGNLARYMAPGLVDKLAQTDNPLGPPRQVNAVVLFADIKGFTAQAQAMGPPQTMAFLRRFHKDMADAVFVHQGTLDKFIGDGLMATFGALDQAPAQLTASHAVQCALEMHERVAAWNRERAEADEAPVLIGIGLHYGPVTIGDMGHASRLEFAVIGDTVNLASRIEGMTREYQCSILASRDVATLAPQCRSWLSVGEAEPYGRKGRIELFAFSAVPVADPNFQGLR